MYFCVNLEVAVEPDDLRAKKPEPNFCGIPLCPQKTDPWIPLRPTLFTLGLGWPHHRAQIKDMTSIKAERLQIGDKVEWCVPVDQFPLFICTTQAGRRCFRAMTEPDVFDLIIEENHEMAALFTRPGDTSGDFFKAWAKRTATIDIWAEGNLRRIKSGDLKPA